MFDKLSNQGCFGNHIRKSAEKLKYFPVSVHDIKPTAVMILEKIGPVTANIMDDLLYEKKKCVPPKKWLQCCFLNCNNEIVII